MRRTVSQIPSTIQIPFEFVFPNKDNLTRQECLDVLHEVFEEKEFNIAEEGLYICKAPGNAFVVDQLCTLFPESRFICILRDIRDVVTSYRQSNISWMKGKNNDIQHLLSHQTKRLSGMLGAKPYGNVHMLHFELLHQRFGVEFRKILSFLDFDDNDEIIDICWDRAMLKNENGRKDLQANPDSGRRQGCIGEWRRVLDENDLNAIYNQEIFQETFNYSSVTTGRHCNTRHGFQGAAPGRFHNFNPSSDELFVCNDLQWISTLIFPDYMPSADDTWLKTEDTIVLRSNTKKSKLAATIKKTNDDILTAYIQTSSDTENVMYIDFDLFQSLDGNAMYSQSQLSNDLNTKLYFSALFET